jgi:ribonuclease PH/non-canonical purine NTP pyrophosphatase (RdgB/HAM1 family)
VPLLLRAGHDVRGLVRAMSGATVARREYMAVGDPRAMAGRGHARRDARCARRRSSRRARASRRRVARNAARGQRGRHCASRARRGRAGCCAFHLRELGQGERRDVRARHPFRESDPPNPLDAYGASKWAAERALCEVAESTGMRATILRLPLTYGPGAKANIAALARALRRGIPLPLSAIENRRSVLGVGNLASALLALVASEGDAQHATTYFVADANAVSTPALVEAMARAMRVRSRLFALPTAALRIAGAWSGRSEIVERLLDTLEVDTAAFPRAVCLVPAVFAGRRHGAGVRIRRAAIIRTIMPSRYGGRRADELRPLRFTRGFTKHAEGSVLVEMGETRVLCTVSVEEGVPAFMKGRGEGWLTAEYGCCRARRTPAAGAKPATASSRAAPRRSSASSAAASARSTDLAALGERTLKIDCDVLQADGGTRCASITGACVAVADAIAWCRARGLVAVDPMRDFVGAVSVGIVGGVPVLDLDYAEDSGCDTDMNVVMTGRGGFVELQGTAEGAPFTREEMDALVGLASAGHPRHRLGAEGRAGLMERLVLASSNEGKLREMRRLLSPLGIEVVAQGELGIADAEEPHATFVENALAKARHACTLSALPALADDSGVCVAALGGEPGVHSARYAGEPRSDARNNEKLIAALAGVADRRAHYACVLVLVRRAGDPSRSSRRAAGTAASSSRPRGAGGFGYDPHFEDLETGLTGAELPLARKNELSHRGKAMRALIERLMSETAR